MCARISPLCVALLVTFASMGCSDDNESQSKTSSDSACHAVTLPLGSTADAPTLTQLILHCEVGGQLVPEVIVTDPQGDADVQNVTQWLAVHKRRDCTGDVVGIEDDVVGSGQAESLGTVVDRTQDQALYDAICASSSWPVRVRIRDATNNETTGVVEAAVIRD